MHHQNLSWQLKETRPHDRETSLFLTMLADALLSPATQNAPHFSTASAKHSAICSAAMLLTSEAMMSYCKQIQIAGDLAFTRHAKGWKKELLENVSATAMDSDRKRSCQVIKNCTARSLWVSLRCLCDTQISSARMQRLQVGVRFVRLKFKLRSDPQFGEPEQPRSPMDVQTPKMWYNGIT